jgi:hypothetical protein
MSRSWPYSPTIRYRFFRLLLLIASRRLALPLRCPGRPRPPGTLDLLVAHGAGREVKIGAYIGPR